MDILKKRYHTNPVPHSLGWKVALELGTNHSTVSMSPCDFPPDDARLVGFTARCGSVPSENITLKNTANYRQKPRLNAPLHVNIISV